MSLASIFPFLSWFRLISKESLKADFLAGLPPEYGLYTAMVTPIVAALFGSSFHLVSGPTTAISIVVFSAISHHAEPGTAEFLSLTLTLTFLAGVYQLAFGLARLGALVNFVSHTVVIGFTAGAAILIATSQMQHITGIPVPKGESFLHIWVDLFQGSASLNLYLLVIGMATLLTAIASKKFFPKLPNLLIGMVVGSVIAVVFKNFTADIKLVGEIPAHLPPFSIPEFSLATIKMLAPEAFAVALLGLIEAVSISRAVATKSYQRINANQEFIGQGMSNIFGSFFSSYAGSGSFTRSGVNYASGAKTPLSAIFAALFLMVIVLLIAPLTAYLPIAAMGGVILLVAYKLIDFHHIRQTLSFSKTESTILLTTFFATLFLELEFAIYLGVLLSLVLFLAKTSTPGIPTLSIDDQSENNHRKFITKITDNERIYNILIVASGINFIDLAGAEALVAENNRLKSKNGGLYFVDLKPSVYEFAAKSFFIKQIGNNHFFDSKAQAIHRIYGRLDRSICLSCNALIFNECK